MLDDVRAGFENHDSSSCFSILMKVGRKVRKISSSLQYREVEISFQVTIFLSSLDDDTKWRQFLHPCKMSRMPLKPEYPSVFVCQTCPWHWGFVSPMKIHLFLFLFCDPEYFLLIEKQKKIHYTSDDGCFEASQMLRRLIFLRVSIF